MTKQKLLFVSLLIGLISFRSVSPVYSQKVVYANDTRNEDTLHYDGPNYTAVMVGTHYRGAARFTPETAGTLMAIIFYHWEIDIQPGTVYVYEEGSPTHPGPKVRVVPFLVTGQGWHRINLNTPYPYSADVDFWTAIEVFYIGRYPIGLDSGPAVDGRGDWVSLDYGQTWDELQNYGLDYNWNIRAIVHLEGGGIEEEILPQQNETRLEVYPNPSSRILNIRLWALVENPKLTIFDVAGKKILSYSMREKCREIKIDTKDLPSGIYFMQLQTPYYKETKKVILLK